MGHELLMDISQDLGPLRTVPQEHQGIFLILSRSLGYDRLAAFDVYHFGMLPGCSLVASL